MPSAFQMLWAYHGAAGADLWAAARKSDRAFGAERKRKNNADENSRRCFAAKQLLASLDFLFALCSEQSILDQIGRFTLFTVVGGGALHTLQAWQVLFTREFCFPLFFY